MWLNGSGRRKGVARLWGFTGQRRKLGFYSKHSWTPLKHWRLVSSLHYIHRTTGSEIPFQKSIQVTVGQWIVPGRKLLGPKVLEIGEEAPATMWARGDSQEKDSRSRARKRWMEEGCILKIKPRVISIFWWIRDERKKAIKDESCFCLILLEQLNTCWYNWLKWEPPAEKQVGVEKIKSSGLNILSLTAF